MILNKLNKIILLALCIFFTQCYTDPFFELTVKVVGQDFNPISNVMVKIEVTGVDNGEVLPGSIIYFESTSDNNGNAFFNFENKAFVTARVCLPEDSSIKGQGFVGTCREGHIYLEENTNKELSLMLEEADCNYCL